MGVLDNVENLLNGAGIKYTREQGTIMMRWQTDHFEDLKLKIVTNNDETWLYIIAPFTDFYQVDSAKQMNLALDMLKQSWLANGVKFALDNDNNIVVVAETNDTDLTVNEIRTLVSHVVHAC
ncbi:MAG: hypothetical protein GF411_12945, partial [Candidatus Lokiarchaeota archaeon]|nr:hypothetical protein [Candidatus Lokiarchaeota archaeon]